MVENIESAVKGIRDPDLKEQLIAEAETNETKALAMARRIKASQGLLTWKLIAAVLFFVALLYIYFGSVVGPDSAMSDVAIGRSFLMVLIVTATIVLGGAMINAGMFQEGVDKERFDRVREIFLFFSGISATVVGFYFGSTTDGENAAVAPVSVGVTLEQGGTISAIVTGGTGPFQVVLKTGDAEAGLLRAEGEELSYSLAPSSNLCPAGGSLLVRGAQSSTSPPFAVPFSPAELNAAGWSACAADQGATPPPDPDEAAGDAGEA